MSYPWKDANDDRWWDEVDDKRLALERARYLRRTTEYKDDKRPILLSLAYRQLGYSHSGIASRVGVNEATVGAYMDELAERYGGKVIESKLPSDLAEWPNVPLEVEDGE